MVTKRCGVKAKTKGQVEARISEAMIKFEKEHMGRGPTEAKTYIMEDVVFVRLKGVLTLAEKQLAKRQEGKVLIKRVRVQLLEDSRSLLKNVIQELTKAKVISMHTDISTRTGERVIIFTLNKNIENNFANNS
ncbi:DUF2294 domain-containing protein [bacterium]|nr:DUF2294 domain-containing protein [bacterium]